MKPEIGTLILILDIQSNCPNAAMPDKRTLLFLLETIGEH